MISTERVQQQSGRRAMRIVIAVLATAAAVTFAAPAGAAPSRPAEVGAVQVQAVALAKQMVSFDHQMITLVNQARAKAHVPALIEAAGLTRLSVWWSSQELGGATGYKLAHNPNAWTMLTSYGAANRQAWGENVAWSSSTSTSATAIFTAYMNSPGHRANILSSSYRYIGMGTVGGSHGLYNTTEFTDAVQAGQAVSAPVTKAPALRVPNGSFVRDTSNGAVYRMIGGAPVYVSSWTSFGGVRPATSISHAQLTAMPLYPANGTFVRTRGSGAVYRIAGGAPIYVSSWAPFSGPKPTLDIDLAAISHGGQAGVWSHLRWSPLTTTYLKAAGQTAVYRVIYGRVSHLTSWSLVGGIKPVTLVDPRAISRAGTGGYFNHLSK